MAAAVACFLFCTLSAFFCCTMKSGKSVDFLMRLLLLLLEGEGVSTDCPGEELCVSPERGGRVSLTGVVLTESVATVTKVVIDAGVGVTPSSSRIAARTTW